jgi:hypothetical protein
MGICTTADEYQFAGKKPVKAPARKRRREKGSRKEMNREVEWCSWYDIHKD